MQASDVTAVAELAHEMSGATAEISSDAINQIIEHYEKAGNEVDNFREKLKAIANTIIQRRTERGIGKLVVLVDELDRCRPDYAVRVLECIKHFFSVDNVVFVIAIDRQQLRGSISAVYGHHIDLDGYIRKFFDYQIELATPDPLPFANLLSQTFALSQIFEGNQRKQNEIQNSVKLFAAWARRLGLTLRVQEQIFSQANFIIRSYGPQRVQLMYNLVFSLLCIRAADPDLFARLEIGAVPIGELESSLNKLARSRPIEDQRQAHEEASAIDTIFAIMYVGFYQRQIIAVTAEVMYDQLNGPEMQAKDGVVRRELERRAQLFMAAAAMAADHGDPLGLLLGSAVCNDIRFLATN